MCLVIVSLFVHITFLFLVFVRLSMLHFDTQSL